MLFSTNISNSLHIHCWCTRKGLMNCQHAASASSTVSCWELLSDCAVLFNTTRDKVADIDPVKSDMLDADGSDSGKTCCPYKGRKPI